MCTAGLRSEAAQPWRPRLEDWRWRHEAGGRSSAGHQLSVAGSWPQTAHLQGVRHIAHLQGVRHIEHAYRVTLQTCLYNVTATKIQSDSKLKSDNQIGQCY